MSLRIGTFKNLPISSLQYPPDSRPPVSLLPFRPEFLLNQFMGSTIYSLNLHKSIIHIYIFYISIYRPRTEITDRHILVGEIHRYNYTKYFLFFSIFWLHTLWTFQNINLHITINLKKRNVETVVAKKNYEKCGNNLFTRFWYCYIEMKNKYFRAVRS